MNTKSLSGLVGVCWGFSGLVVACQGLLRVVGACWGLSGLFGGLPELIGAHRGLSWLHRALLVFQIVLLSFSTCIKYKNPP